MRNYFFLIRASLQKVQKGSRTEKTKQKGINYRRNKKTWHIYGLKHECLAKWKRPKEGMSLWNLTATQIKTLRAFRKTEGKKKANTVDYIHKMRP